MAIHRRRLGIRRQKLTVAKILRWANYEFRQTGRWPKSMDREVLADPREKWININSALKAGLRGLPGGDTLPQLLARKRGVRNIRDLSPLTVDLIVGWAEAHHRQTGAWPNHLAGDVSGVPGERWQNIDRCLRFGGRSLPGGSSLARLLEQSCGVRSKALLNEEQIVQWAKAHRERTGRWPSGSTRESLPEAPQESWPGINACLHFGCRGLPGGDSLAQLLARKANAVNRTTTPRLTIKKILGWASAHRKRTGEWPRVNSGPVVDAPGLTWLGIDLALRRGARGLKTKSSLYQLSKRFRGSGKKDRPS